MNIKVGADRHDGIMVVWSLAQTFYSTVRPYLPATRRCVYNGVVMGKRYPFIEDYLPGEFSGIQPAYKQPNVAAIREHVSAEDNVVIVGAGQGVTTVVAARQAWKGSVYAYEPGSKWIELTERTVRLNAVDDRVTLIETTVGDIITSQGSDTSTAGKTNPEELPECDVLELDCEGAEIEIITGLRRLPEVIIVETHGFRGAPTEETIAAIEDRGYEVVERMPVEGGEKYASERDAYVLIASETHDGSH